MTDKQFEKAQKLKRALEIEIEPYEFMAKNKDKFMDLGFGNLGAISCSHFSKKAVEQALAILEQDLGKRIEMMQKRFEKL